MSNLNVRAIATLGIGFGPVLVAYLGLWPLADVTPPVQIGPLGGGVFSVIQKRTANGLRDDGELLELVPIIVEIINARR